MSVPKLKRGFKTHAEKKSNEIREKLDLSPISPLPSAKLANHFNVRMLGLSEITHIYDERTVKRLLVEDFSSWSAVTIPHPDGDFIIYNCSHSEKKAGIRLNA